MLRSLGGQSDGVLPRNAISADGTADLHAADGLQLSIRRASCFPEPQTLAPEFGIDNAATALARANFVNTLIMQGGAKADPTVTGSTGTSIDLTALSAISDPSALIAQLNLVLMHGSLSSSAAA